MKGRADFARNKKLSKMCSCFGRAEGVQRAGRIQGVDGEVDGVQHMVETQNLASLLRPNSETTQKFVSFLDAFMH